MLQIFEGLYYTFRKPGDTLMNTAGFQIALRHKKLLVNDTAAKQISIHNSIVKLRAP